MHARWREAGNGESSNGNGNGHAAVTVAEPHHANANGNGNGHINGDGKIAEQVVPFEGLNAQFAAVLSDALKRNGGGLAGATMSSEDDDREE
jgi:hypothetical protein